MTAASSSAVEAESFTNPPPEGTGRERPQSPGGSKPVVMLAGPTVEGGAPDFTLDDRDQCASFLLTEPLNEDVRVEKVSFAPSGAFVRDDSPCGDATLCFGYVFPKGAGSCAVGIRWKPETGISAGTAALTLGAICTTRQDVLCSELKEPTSSDGVAVRFSGGWGLHSVLLGGTDEPATGSPPMSVPPTATGSPHMSVPPTATGSPPMSVPPMSVPPTATG
jgi:hypothetical protein